MWTSPARLRLSDATWLVPLGGFTAALLATDTDISLASFQHTKHALALSPHFRLRRVLNGGRSWGALSAGFDDK